VGMTTDASIPETAQLPTEECWRLLRGASVGRLAVWVHDHPEIFPINYKVHHESLVFPTVPVPSLRLPWAKWWHLRPMVLTLMRVSPGVLW
jgi:hypothetical protein